MIDINKLTKDVSNFLQTVFYIKRVQTEVIEKEEDKLVACVQKQEFTEEYVRECKISDSIRIKVQKVKDGLGETEPFSIDIDVNTLDFTIIGPMKLYGEKGEYEVYRSQLEHIFQKHKTSPDRIYSIISDMLCVGFRFVKP